MDSIKYIEHWGAPLLIGMGLALLIWAYINADGFGPMLSQPDQFETRADFWRAFFPGLTAMVGFWATLSLNIPDFTRHARSQRDQMLGQFLGLNTTMPFYAFVGVAVTSASVVIFGEAIWNPVDLLARFDAFGLILVSMFALALATLTTNMAANVVAPATAFSNFLPRLISLRSGALITGLIGIVIMPWKLLADPNGYIFTWLIGYSALLGPIGGVLIADYFVVRRTRLTLADLYQRRGAYGYGSGFNPAAILALIAAIAPNVPGFLNQIGVVTASPFWASLYHYAWFIGFGVAFVAYLILMPLFGRTRPAAE
jgi:NCS1 family nucleobase:cation symporter-1